MDMAIRVWDVTIAVAKKGKRKWESGEWIERG